MKKPLLLFSFLTILLAGAHPALAGVIEKSYTIEFKTAANNNQPNATEPSDIITDESIMYVTGISATNASAGTEGLKLGTAGNPGSLTMSLAENVHFTPTKIVVNAAKYDGDAPNDISIKVGAAIKNVGSVSSSFKDLTWDIETNVILKELRLSNSEKRVYIKSVTVYYEEKGQDPSSGDVPQTLFHETFGDNPNSAQVWMDEYSVKSGVQSVYTNVAYTMANVKQSKNTMGHKQSGLNQSTKAEDAVFEAGPFALSSATNVSLSYYWKAASINATYSTNIYYSTDGGASYTELTHSATGATTFVEVKVSVPTPLTDNTYFKVVFNTSNTQAAIDEFDISGILTTPSVSELDYADIAQLNDIPDGTLVKITNAYVIDMDGEKTLVVYDLATGNITARYAIVTDETAEQSFVENRIHNVIGEVSKSDGNISLVNAVIADCGDPSLAIETVPEITFEENGVPAENDYQFIDKPVNITHPFIGDGFANATIYYTRDGSVPNIEDARDENASATDANSRAQESISDPTLDEGTFVYSGPFYAVHPDNWDTMEYGKSIVIKAVAVPSMPGAHLWTASAVAETLPIHITTGITDITAPDADATFYTIQGIRVANPSAGNIYIRVADGQATKVRF